MYFLSLSLSHELYHIGTVGIPTAATRRVTRGSTVPPGARMEGASSEAEAEAELIFGQRIFGCELIQKMGVLLKLPQVAVSTACVSFHRFYIRRSFRKSVEVYY